MRRLLAGAAVAVLLAGCGGGPDEPALSPAAAEVLGADVDALTAAARADDAARVQDLLLQLRTHVEQYAASGDLTEERGAQVLAAAARVATDVGAPAPKVLVSVAPAPKQPAPERPAEEPKGEGDKKAEKGGDDEQEGKDDD